MQRNTVLFDQSKRTYTRVTRAMIYTQHKHARGIPIVETDYPQSAAELSARMDTALARLLGYTDTLTEAQQLEPTDAAGWNVRDHIAHLVVWAAGITALLRRADRWAAMGIGAPGKDDGEQEPDAYYDRSNAQIRLQHTHESPAQARAALLTAHAAVIAAVEALPFAELSMPYDHFVTPFTGDTGYPALSYIAGNGYEHYDEHLPWIRAIVERPA